MSETQAQYEMRCVLETGRTRTRVHRELLEAFAADWSTTKTFPCGCRLLKVDTTITIEPCSLDCFVMHMIDTASSEAGNASHVIVDPEADTHVADEAIRRYTR